jgi:hypothetical protein
VNRKSDWKSIILNSRLKYNGSITYAASPVILSSFLSFSLFLFFLMKRLKGGEETDLTWWDQVDYIGIEAYYPVGGNDASLEEVKNAWHRIIDFGIYGEDDLHMHGGLKNLSQTWNKHIIFTGVGYCSGDCPKGTDMNLDYQTTRISAFFDVFRVVEWIEGVFWWNWVTDPAFGGEQNPCTTIQFKPAENVLRLGYGERKPGTQPQYPPVCPCVL